MDSFGHGRNIGGVQGGRSIMRGCETHSSGRMGGWVGGFGGGGGGGELLCCVWVVDDSVELS